MYYPNDISTTSNRTYNMYAVCNIPRSFSRIFISHCTVVPFDVCCVLNANVRWPQTILD